VLTSRTVVWTAPPKIFGYCPVWHSTKKNSIFWSLSESCGPYWHFSWRKFISNVFGVTAIAFWM